MNDYVIIGLILGLFLMLFWLRRPTLSAKEAKALVADGARLVDVRTPGEFSRGHLRGAVNVPLDRVASEIGEQGLLGPTTTPLVLYCASGMRSASAMKLLKRKGYQSTHNLGSMGRWEG